MECLQGEVEALQGELRSLEAQLRDRDKNCASHASKIKELEVMGGARGEELEPVVSGGAQIFYVGQLGMGCYQAQIKNFGVRMVNKGVIYFKIHVYS